MPMVVREVVKTPKEFTECTNRVVKCVYCEYLQTESIIDRTVVEFWKVRWWLFQADLLIEWHGPGHYDWVERCHYSKLYNSLPFNYSILSLKETLTIGQMDIVALLLPMVSREIFLCVEWTSLYFSNLICFGNSCFCSTCFIYTDFGEISCRTEIRTCNVVNSSHRCKYIRQINANSPSSAIYLLHVLTFWSLLFRNSSC